MMIYKVISDRFNYLILESRTTIPLDNKLNQFISSKLIELMALKQHDIMDQLSVVNLPIMDELYSNKYEL